MATERALDFSRPGRPQIGREKSSPPLPSPPPSYSPRSYSKEALVDQISRPSKRRPLSSSSANTGSRSSAQASARDQDKIDISFRPVQKRHSSFDAGDDQHIRLSQNTENEEPTQDYENQHSRAPSGPPPITQSIPYRQTLTQEAPIRLLQPQTAVISSVESSGFNSRHTSGESFISTSSAEESAPPLQYHHQPFDPGANARLAGRRSVDSSASQPFVQRPATVSRSSNQHLTPTSSTHLGPTLSRPASAYSVNSDPAAPGRTLSPAQYSNARSPSPSRGSPDSRPMSYIDLLNVPYPQPPPAPSNLDNSHLRQAIGENASLLGTKKTLDMYRANVKKTSDPTIQYEFAVFMISTAQEMAASGEDDRILRQPSPKPSRDLDGPHVDSSTLAGSRAELIREARHILQRLSDRSYPYAQYYLADGYSSGLLNKGVEDNDKAFHLFVAASKHGHAEAGYRAALCYEFGWGCRKDSQKAVQFYRQSASKNHPGAMSRLGRACLVGEMGLGNRYREGLKWLKRAAESADFQYNSAPYELGLLHETGYGDDIFLDEAYAAQLFTQSADLGHVEANYRLGDSYEHGKLSCPKDPALSVHFYTRAAERGHPLAMMALCAWYMVGAEPVLEKDENEAYEWARKAAETGTLIPL